MAFQRAPSAGETMLSLALKARTLSGFPDVLV
jgi:hypothetical protein